MVDNQTPPIAWNVTLDSMLAKPATAGSFAVQQNENKEQVFDVTTPPVANAPATGWPGIAGWLGTYQKKPSTETPQEKEIPWLAPPTTIVLIIIFSLISFVFYYLNTYFTQASQVVVDEKYNNQIARVHWLQKTINAVWSWNDVQLYENLSFLTETANDTVQTIVATDRLNYVHKRDLTHKAIQELGNDIIAQKNHIDALKANIAEFGFYPEEISLLLKTDKTKASLQDSLLSLETIKFATAIKVFSLLDSFTTPVTRQNRTSKEYVNKQLRLFVERGEVDIANYLQTCRHNPFESIRNGCNVIEDFEKYFVYQEQEESFDTDLFKNILQFAEQKIEEEDFPSLSLAFDRFDPNSQKLSFTARINTTSFDRAQLKAAGVSSPHVFVVTNLVNLLKQSKFVIGENININKLNVVRKQVNIGGTIEEIHSSELRFSLPLQKSSQREIFDYLFKEQFDATSL